MRSVRRKVQKVIDGDTFKVRRRVRGTQFVRIAGLNAPERGKRGYSAAKKKLSRLEGKVVTIRPVGRSYGRVIATVFYRRRKLRR